MAFEYYSNRKIMSYDRNDYPYKWIIGARGVGKTFSSQNLMCNHYHDIKHFPSDPSNVDDLFLLLRLTDAALANALTNILDSKLQKKHNIIPKAIQHDKYYSIYFNGRLVGHGMSLQNAPHYKGGTWNWQRYKYVFLDEFQRERRERRTFDVVYNLRSILESVTRFSTRLKEGLDLPHVIGTANTIDEATDILFQFDFMPLKYGIYKLKKKFAIIEYIEDGKAYQRLQKRNPLRVLGADDDFTFGERRISIRDNIIDPLKTGGRRYIGHLQITDYIRFEVWQIQKGNHIYISSGLPTAKWQNRNYTLARLAANRGTTYSVDFHKLIRKNYELNNIAFDKNITAKIFNMNVV